MLYKKSPSLFDRLFLSFHAVCLAVVNSVIAGSCYRKGSLCDGVLAVSERCRVVGVLVPRNRDIILADIGNACRFGAERYSKVIALNIIAADLIGKLCDIAAELAALVVCGYGDLSLVDGEICACEKL